MDENKRVMETLLEQCRQAYHGRKPLIMVDTEEIELMNQLALRSNLVDLLDQDAYDKKLCKYYTYVGHLPEALEKAKNFSLSTECLEELRTKGNVMEYQKPPMLVLVHLNHDDLDTVEHISRLRGYVDSYVRCRILDSALRSSCVLLYGDPGLLPKDLLPYTEILAVEYPQKWEIQETILRIVRENGKELEDAVAKEIAELMVGFSLIQVEQYTQRLLWVDGKNGKRVIYDPEEREKIILDAKAAAIRSTGGLLTLYREKKKKKPAFPDQAKQENDGASRENGLGGMEDYKTWAAAAGDQMSKNSRYALDVGVPSMKGVLLCGVPGCGKSEAAKILHREWGLPMLRMDVDQLMGGLVGDSERNMRQALALAEAMSPCILWIDEIEKGFSGAASSQGDGGTFKRMFGRLLTWMQENKKPCFIFATANDISFLPPEFFRSGRFDALFSVYMPTNKECKEIFAEQMRRAEKLRDDSAEEQGGVQARPKLFNEKCFEDRYLQVIMNYFTEGVDIQDPQNVKFVSGADIQKITTNALKKILAAKQTEVREKHPEIDKEEEIWEKAVKLATPIKVDTWTAAVGEVIKDPTITTQGSSYANLDKIAACYVRLMRENFAPVSSKDQQLFKKAYYKCDTVEDQFGERIMASYTGECEQTNDYDKALFYTLKKRIEKIASRMETNALNRVCE